MRYMNCAAGELKRGINCMIIVFKQLAVAARASIDVPEYRNKYTLNPSGTKLQIYLYTS